MINNKISKERERVNGIKPNKKYDMSLLQYAIVIRKWWGKWVLIAYLSKTNPNVIWWITSLNLHFMDYICK